MQDLALQRTTTIQFHNPSRKEIMPILALYLSMPVTWMWRAFVLVKLWTWFILPVGAPRLTFLAAMGLSLITAILISPVKVSKEPDEKIDSPHVFKVVGYAFSVPGFALLMGWALHLFTA